MRYQRYTPYGWSPDGCSIGFNGQWRDPVTGWYHLGNGYRVYNPVLMCFHTPDRWSPFTSGETNAYSYCAGDPINRIDPSGHSSSSRLRRWLIRIVFIAGSILAGALTAGASLAVQIGVSIAVGITTHVVTGVVYDLATGQSPTWGSVGRDALAGIIAGFSRGVGKGPRVVKKVSRKALETLENITETRDMQSLDENQSGKGEASTDISSNSGRPGDQSSLTSDNRIIQSISQTAEQGLLYPSSPLAAMRITVGPHLLAGNRANLALAGSSPQDRTFALDSAAAVSFGDGRAMAEVLNLEHKCYFGSLSPLEDVRPFVVDDAFTKTGSFKMPSRPIKNTVRRSHNFEILQIPEDASSN